MPTELRAKKAASESSYLAAASRDPDLIAIVQFCAIGLLITLISMLSFPDLGAIIAQYNQF
ncbi:MAG: hypothetical protein WAK55_08705 [Xanthobacteraceae bacterium]